MAQDLEDQYRLDRDHRCRAAGADRHLLLPGRAGAAATRLRVGPAGLSRFHAALARLVCERPAFRRQRRSPSRTALVTGFNWEFFLAAPLIFILWAAIAAGLLFWGRGPFCGWLCPFGALQELLNNLAQWLKVPQVKVPWGLHERLWPIKYIIFLGLFGLSLYSVALAEVLAEVEPFKTAIILKFARDWPFVIYALTLLAAGLFIERFFCRYLCPLGAALAIPGRIRMFEWLKRWPDCGSPCQRCAKECPVQSIHPEGFINVNECIYCMHCQELYHDDQRCPHMIQVRLKREKRLALSSPSMRSIKDGGRRTR